MWRLPDISLEALDLVTGGPLTYDEAREALGKVDRNDKIAVVAALRAYVILRGHADPIAAETAPWH